MKLRMVADCSKLIWKEAVLRKEKLKTKLEKLKMNFQCYNGRSRGRREYKRNRSETSIPRPLREDMWAYELIANSFLKYQKPAEANPSYYLNPRKLLKLLYPHCYKSWERSLKNQGYKFESPYPPPFERSCNDTVNNIPQYPQSNNCEVDSKNLLLLSTVADMEQRNGRNAVRRRNRILKEFHNEQGILLGDNNDIRRNYMGDECTDSSKNMQAFTPAVFIKTEDESGTFMGI